jgi:hypothetical protein
MKSPNLVIPPVLILADLHLNAGEGGGRVDEPGVWRLDSLVGSTLKMPTLSF